MTKRKEAQADYLEEAIARWENEGGAASRPKTHKATS
jgi:hypothetical protein